VALGIVVWTLPFGWLEKVFGYLGLCLLVYVVAALQLGPDWGALGRGFVPNLHGSSLFAYFAVGLIGAALMPYEVYFYSSGAVEEGWGVKDLSVNRFNAIAGFGLGGILVVALVVTAAEVFHPLMVQPEFIATTALGASTALGQAGLILALTGIVFAVGGAAIDSCFAGAYSVSQFFGWEWGKYRTPEGAPRFTLAWIALLALAYVVISTGVDPVILTEYAVVGSVVALPLTYLPVLLIARDRTFMGSHANGRISSFLGWIYLLVIALVAISAIPLLIITNAGNG
jgi:Mn2+/Fe2+ NRAMP family transporter